MNHSSAELLTLRGRMLAAVMVVAALVVSLFVSATPAFAGSHGVG